MFILLVIFIDLAFVRIFNFHCFKSFLLSLFIWSYFTIKWSLFSPFLFRSFSWCSLFFFVIFHGFVCWGFMWVMLVVTSTATTIIIVFLLSLLIVSVSTFPIGTHDVFSTVFMSWELNRLANFLLSITHSFSILMAIVTIGRKLWLKGTVWLYSKILYYFQSPFFTVGY